MYEDDEDIDSYDTDYTEIFEEDIEDDLEETLGEICPECGSEDVDRNDYDFLVCHTCGYEEIAEEDMGVCIRCGEATPEEFLYKGLCPVCADDML